MLDLYYKDFSENKEGTWGIEPNRLIRFDLEGNQLYFYDFKENTFGMSLLSSILNTIVDPLRFVLVDDGEVMPISLFERYKFFNKITTEYYHVKNQSELKKKFKAIRSMGNNKPQPTSKSKNRLQNRLDRMADVINNKRMKNSGYKRDTITINKHSGNVTDLNKINNKIIRLIENNKERVRRGY